MPSMNEKDYYAILGVDKDADKKAIQKAFQQKARKLHPDVNKAPDAEERFKEVSEAYAVLSDDQKRARYDSMRSGNPFASSPTAGNAAANPFSGYGYQGGFTGFPFGFPFDMGGMGGRGRSGNAAYSPEEGADILVEVDLTREEASHGTRRGIKYERYEPCGHCHGSGSVATEHSRACPTCGGRGSINVDLSGFFGAGAVHVTCPECGGSGRVVADPCPSCSGSGRTRVMAERIVEFPAGTHDGDIVRIPGVGHAGTNGAAAGDLVARARVTSERLGDRARMGFYSIGFVLPFLVLGVFTGMSPLLAVICIAGALYGIVTVVGEKPWTRGGLWWRRGVQAAGNGAANSLIWVLILAWITSCSRSLAAPFYRMF